MTPRRLAYVRIQRSSTSPTSPRQRPASGMGKSLLKARGPLGRQTQAQNVKSYVFAQFVFEDVRRTAVCVVLVWQAGERDTSANCRHF